MWQVSRCTSDRLIRIATSAVRSPSSAAPEDTALRRGLTLAELLVVLGALDAREEGTS